MKNLERVAEVATNIIGTPQSLVVHALWFILWFIFHLDVGLLTNLVSLEAIFLAIFIQLSVNGHHKTSKKMHRKILDMEQQINNNELKMKAVKKGSIKKAGSFEGKSNKLGHGGRAAQLKAKGVPGGVIGNLARKAGAAPGGPNYHGGKK